MNQHNLQADVETVTTEVTSKCLNTVNVAVIDALNSLIAQGHSRDEVVGATLHTLGWVLAEMGVLLNPESPLSSELHMLVEGYTQAKQTTLT